MAKSADATATVTPATREPKLFDHGGRFVVVVVPQNSKHETYVRQQFEERFEEPPALTNALKVAEISQDTIIYLAHPIRTKRKATDRSGREVWKKAVDLHISRPIDVAAECTDSPRRGAKLIDFNKIVQAMMKVVKNDPAGWFFSPFLSGFHKADFTEATIQLVNR
jgi:hypothetical protein